MSTRQNNLIFMDTWAWLALSNRKDTHHELAKKEYEEIKAAGYRIITSDYVLDEVITALFRNVVFGSAVQFVESIFATLKAYKLDKISRLKNELDNLRANGFWFSDRLYKELIKCEFDHK